MDPDQMENLTTLREVNTALLKLSLRDTDPDVAGECDRARQPVVEAIRKLDPESAANPPPEEMDVARFHAVALGAGKLLTEQIEGRTPGGSSN